MTQRLLLTLLGPALAIGAWWAVAAAGLVAPIFLPTPLSTVHALIEFYNRGWLWPALLHSTSRVFTALALVSITAVPLGILLGAVPRLREATSLVVDGFKSIPITGFLGLIVLWFGVDDGAKVAFLFLGSFFYMVALVRNAIASTDSGWVETAQLCGASKRQVVWTVLIPSALPQIWEAVCINHGIMWTYVVLAEFFNSSEQNLGLGYLIYISGRTQRTAAVFAAILLIAVVTSVVELLFSSVGRRFLFPWRSGVNVS